MASGERDQRPDVAYIRVRGARKEDVCEAVKKAMELADWKAHLCRKGIRKIFVKVNLLSDQLVPGQCTSPWVLEGALRVLRTSGAEIIVGDADVATAKQLEPAARIWGIKDVCRRMGVKFLNLSKQPTALVDIGGKIFKRMPVPAILLEADAIVTLPVVKTHNVTTMTCSLKNQWGCIPTFRHQYHLVADKCIADINSFLHVKFAVADATVCLEENGPRVGRPKFVGAVMASADRVALDSVACAIIGVEPKKVAHIREAAKRRLGSTAFRIRGDRSHFRPRNFRPALVHKHPIVRTELFLRKIPIVNWIIFKTPLFKIPAWFAAKYNSFWWYNREGKMLAQDIVKRNELAKNEFGPLLKRIGKL